MIPDFVRVFGPEHRATLACQVCIIELLVLQGKKAEAEEQCCSFIPTATRILGPEDAQTLGVRKVLADLLKDEAKKALKKQDSPG